MKSSRILCAGVLLMIACCNANRPAPQRIDAHVAAAHLFTQRFAASRFAAWHIRASAAGRDCSVLLVETSILVDEAMIDALHYGAGAYEIYKGGVQQFTRERAFRGVAYRDVSGRIWTYGNVTASEVEGIAPCH